jgi:immune inhibitor A
MPVDARPAPTKWSDGTMPAPRRQVQDAAFGLQATDAATFRKEVLTGTGKSQTVQTLSVTAGPSSAIPTFNDTNTKAYWSAELPLSSIYVAGHGVIATVTGQTTGGQMTITVTNP